MNKSQTLLMARMGFYQSENTSETEGGNLPAILQHQGGFPQQDRMIKDKYRSFRRALKYSYQGAFIQPIGQKEQFRALINSNKLKQDYDDKIVSVDFQYNMKPGDIFNWVNTNTYWIIYLQELTELAYFRGDIRKCNYTIDWLDKDGKRQSTYAAVRGPVETRIESIQKEGNSIDIPNYSLNILIPNNQKTYDYFKRYSKFYLQEDKSICWRIEAIDSVSMPGVIEFNAVEYYINDFYDEDGIVDELKIKPIPEDAITSEIEGLTFIKPKTTYAYVYMGEEGTVGDWSIKEKDIPVEITKTTDTIISLKWNKNYSGQFTLQCGEATKTIVVESLF